MENPILKYFEYQHLPDDLRRVSHKFYSLAHTLSARLPNNAETSTMLRKLLEAKDAAVRSALDLRDDKKIRPLTPEERIAELEERIAEVYEMSCLVMGKVDTLDGKANVIHDNFWNHHHHAYGEVHVDRQEHE